MWTLNLLSSRFKYDELKVVLKEKHRITALLTVFAIFEQLPILKVMALSIIERVKVAGDEDPCLGLVILLFCLKHILRDILSGIRKD